MTKPFRFKIGADPEFNINYNNQIIQANTLIQTLLNEKEKKSKSEQGYKIKKAGEIGWDGCCATAELRPSPTTTPIELTQNIKQLFESITQKTNLFTFSTSSDTFPVGGHIHFQIDNKLVQHPELLKTLHQRLVSFYLPIQLGEEIYNIKTRKYNNYGNFNDFKVECRNPNEKDNKKHIYTFEFRTPSAEWLTTPAITNATIAYLAVVWNEIIHQPKSFKKSEELLLNNSYQNNAIQSLAISQYGVITEIILDKIRKHIKHFEMYEDYKTEINFILNPQKILKEKEKNNFEITKGWKLIQPSQITTSNQLKDTKRIKEKTKNINIETFFHLIEIHSNNDYNINTIVQEIKTRIISCNFPLKNQYIFYGLKKGIPDYIIAVEKETTRKPSFIKGKEIIKTINDLQTIEKTITYIFDKHKEKKNKKRNFIAIGIPYDIRIEPSKTINSIIDILFDIEKTKNTGTTIKTSSLIDDHNDNTTPKGQIFKIYQNQNNEIERITSTDTTNRAENNKETHEIKKKSSQAEIQRTIDHNNTVDEILTQLTKENTSN